MSDIPEIPGPEPNRTPMRPLDLREPFWATSSFKWLVLFAVMFVSIMAVLVFHEAPSLRKPEVGPLPPKPKEIRFDGVLAKAESGSPIDMAEPGYQRVVKHLLTTEPDTLAKSAKDVSYVHFEQHDRELRGETVQVIALLGGSEPLRLDPPVDGREWVYRTIVVDLSGTEGYVVDLLDPPEVKEHRALVQVEGIFVKLCGYTGYDKEKDEYVDHKAPLLLGRRMRLLKEKAAVTGEEMTPWILGVGGVSVVLVLIWSVWVIRQARRGNASRLPVTKLS